MANASLRAADSAKNDEFYTSLSEIQSEIFNYTDKFKEKVVLCNCDDPFESNFVKYFLMNFNRLKLKELISTGYKTSPVCGTEIGSINTPYTLRVTDTSKYLVGTQKDLDIRGAKYFLETEGSKIMTPLIGNAALDENGNQIQITVKEPILDKNGNEILDNRGEIKLKSVKRNLYYEAGDFRSDMSLALLNEADIVVTNPPFSLFREFVSILMSYNKDFLIIGNVNAISYKEIFPLLKNNQVWLGCNNGSKEYEVAASYATEFPDKVYNRNNKYFSKLGNTGWFTTLDHAKRHQMLPLDLGYTYNKHEDMYPKFDYIDAINIDRINHIPCDYTNIMGVPISLMDKYCPEQFEIIDLLNRYAIYDSQGKNDFIKVNKLHSCNINGKATFARILVKFKQGYINTHPDQFKD